MKKIYENITIIPYSIYWIISLCCKIVYIKCRCKLTKTEYSEYSYKFADGYPTGYYKLREGIRYYESGEIAISDYRNRCKLLLTPKQLRELFEKHRMI